MSRVKVFHQPVSMIVGVISQTVSNHDWLEILIHLWNTKDGGCEWSSGVTVRNLCGCARELWLTLCNEPLRFRRDLKLVVQMPGITLNTIRT